MKKITPVTNVKINSLQIHICCISCVGCLYCRLPSVSLVDSRLQRVMCGTRYANEPLAVVRSRAACITGSTKRCLPKFDLNYRSARIFASVRCCASRMTLAKSELGCVILFFILLLFLWIVVFFFVIYRRLYCFNLKMVEYTLPPEQNSCLWCNKLRDQRHIKLSHSTALMIKVSLFLISIRILHGGFTKIYSVLTRGFRKHYMF